MWNPDLKLRRPAITEGFEMPTFAGGYYMWPEEYWLLAKYVDLTAGDYLEIGSMCGIIAMSFAEKYPQRNFVCIDNFSLGHATIAGNKEAFLRNLRDHNLQNVTLVEGDSLQVLPGLSRAFDIVFIDGNHAYEYVLGDAANAWRLVAPGGFIIFHDYDYVEETTRAVKDFLQQTGGRLVETVTSLAVTRKLAETLSAAAPEKMISSSNQGPAALPPDDARLQAEMERLLRQQLALLRQEKNELEAVLQAIQNSAGWRLLNGWRQGRDRLAPPGSRRRRLYDGLLSHLRGGR